MNNRIITKIYLISNSLIRRKAKIRKVMPMKMTKAILNVSINYIINIRRNLVQRGKAIQYNNLQLVKGKLWGIWRTAERAGKTFNNFKIKKGAKVVLNHNIWIS